MSNLMSAGKRAEQLELALAELAKAKRKAGTTLLRWKPDWEAAARHYREACKAYKLSGDTNGTIQGQSQRGRFRPTAELPPREHPLMFTPSSALTTCA